MKSTPKILQNHYVLAVHNVRESAAFYVEALGFHIVSEHGGWIFVSKDNCMIMLGECPDDPAPSALGSHNYFAYLRVDDVDAYYAHLQRQEVEFLDAVADKPWGMREFGIKTPDGHRIMIGQMIGKELGDAFADRGGNAEKKDRVDKFPGPLSPRQYFWYGLSARELAGEMWEACIAMVKQHHQTMNICLGLCDLLVISAAWLGSYQIRFIVLHAQKGVAPWQDVGVNLLVTLLLSLIVMTGSGLYRPRRDKSFLLELGHIIKASILIWGVLIVVLYFTHEEPFTRGMLVLFLPIMTGALILERGLFRSALRRIRRRGWNLRHALIVGTGRLAQSTLHKINDNSWTGIRVRGFVDAHDEMLRDEVRGVKVVGTVNQLRDIVRQQGIDCVFVAIPAKHGERLQRVMHELEQTSADVRIIPDLYLSRFPMNVAVSELDGLPILSLRENPLAGWPGIYKRLFDIAGAGFGLILLGVPMLAMAAAIKLSNRGPVIYRQRRISFGGKSFEIYKFRTMVVGAENMEGPAFATRDDPRRTAVGRVLRSWSLDELPQLFNVIKGDMSLVGPRPERPEMLSKIQEEIPAFSLRLKVRAGLTGWAQINGFRGRTCFRKRLQYDIYYLNNWSPLLDVRIVLATLFRGLRHPNAY